MTLLISGGTSLDHKYFQYSGTNNVEKPYKYISLFGLNSVNCPITSYSLETVANDGLTFSDYKGTNVKLEAD